MLALYARTIVAVTGQTCIVGDNGVPRFGQAIEKGRLADIGSTDQRDYGFHRGLKKSLLRPERIHGASTAHCQQGLASQYRRHRQAGIISQEPIHGSPLFFG